MGAKILQIMIFFVLKITAFRLEEEHSMLERSHSPIKEGDKVLLISCMLVVLLR